MIKEIKRDGNTEYVWYESSNIYFSQVDDLNGKDKIVEEVLNIVGKVVDVNIVFNRGAHYLYKEVHLHDYIAFRECLNREDHESSGKAFNKFIKPYPFERRDTLNLDKVNALRNKPVEKEKLEE